MERKKARNENDADENVVTNIRSDENGNSLLFTHMNYDHNYVSV